ncbi:hypothetical protein AEM51_06005 [Bacteroidetes bacterium UKL13-3]|jgi:hypothetical protein|nr:hypothetical protein AEM51_06005 [Bacteroidetes bacterium UKL13-3]HCP94210.1 hypothetical protein [Bacteroidota bacterium]
MKQRVLIGIGIGLLIIIAGLTYLRSATKKHSPAAIAEYHLSGADITVNYCQPYKKGRLVFGDETSGALQPYGKYWRVGANEATLFSTNKNLLINDQYLKAGKYSVYAYPGKDSWQIVFSSDFDRWGVTQPDPKDDVVKTNVLASNHAPLQEQFTVRFDTIDSANVNMVLHWDETEVTIPMTVQD